MIGGLFDADDLDRAVSCRQVRIFQAHRKGLAVVDVGIVGVGTMGSQMLRKLIAAGHRVSFVDVDSQRQAEARSLGAHQCEHPSDLAEVCDVVLMSLPMDDDVRAVVAGAGGVLAAANGRVAFIVDLSTVDPSTSVGMAGLSARSEVGYVDAPVLGRPATCGQWTLPVGGDPSHIDAVEPVLSALAARVLRVGDVGAGNTVKLLNNLMFGAINGIVVECMSAAPRLGVDQARFYNVIAESNAASVSKLFLELGPKIIDRDFSPAFRLSLLDKDVRLGVAMLHRAGIDPSVARAVAAQLESSRTLGIGDLDTAALVKLYEGQHAPD